MESSGDQKSLDTQKNKCQLLFYAEKVGLCLLIATVWGLLAVPVILYQIPVPVSRFIAIIDCGRAKALPALSMSWCVLLSLQGDWSLTFPDLCADGTDCTSQDETLR